MPSQQISHYLRALRSRWWVVALVTVLAAATALAFNERATKKYDATAQVLVTNQEPIDTLFLTQGQRSLDPERDINTDVALVTTEPVALAVRKQLHLTTSTDGLLREVSAGTAGTSNVISITARDPSPTRARDIANAFATQYVAFRRDQERQTYLQSAELASRALAQLTPQERSGPRGKQLETQLQTLQNAAGLVTGGVTGVESATKPTSPAVPRTKLALAIAIVLGLCVGSLIAIALEFGDRRLKDEAEVEQFLDLPILASVPLMRRWRGPNAEGAVQQEAYATVAVNLRLRDPDAEQPQTVMLASSDPGAGKTAATIGVARALARAGQHVIAIEADLRRPKFASYLNLPSGGGLAAVLAETRRLSEELIELDLLSGPLPEAAPLEVLPAGSVVGNPHTVLASDKMRELLLEARSRADIVLVDTPAVGPVSDAVDLAGSVDTCLLIVRLKHTKQEGVRRALRALLEVEIDVAGVIVTGLTRKPSYAMGYYLTPEQAPVRERPRKRSLISSLLARRRKRATAPSLE